MPWKCPVCGTENPDELNTCRICGAYRPTATTVNLSQADAKISVAFAALLVEVLDSPVKSLVGLVKRIDLTSKNGIVTVGRSLENDVVILDPSVSRRHLRVIIARDGLIIEDLQSTNGTYLLPKGERINVAKVGREALVKIGESILRFILE
ncbi:FHA domain-containing protein [Thermoproteus tenax]|uniref:FHA domain containing protein n=1 Tax=Thermoproteus tenax (strain ATCC 35583 / DSM 2078 / JCM 9277 / NBRC 100435 / Kra 1) TaxID=768679 RepID=G4RLT5_THETK|nr:FHA domain-containing protein [Thermoproteus tenax]CCC82530.1 FHA domain containing protein [Thermoproteus tenax Kra 1]